MSAEASQSDRNTPAHYQVVLQNQVDEGLTALRRPPVGQFLSAVNCGLDLGIGPFLLLIMLTEVGASSLDKPLAKILMAAGYTSGFIFVILGRSELFTEHTILAVVPVLVGEEHPRSTEFRPVERRERSNSIVREPSLAGMSAIRIPGGVQYPTVKIHQPIRSLTVATLVTTAIVAYLVGMPLYPFLVLTVIPFLILIPVELARHWDYLDQHITAYSNREPEEPEGSEGTV